MKLLIIILLSFVHTFLFAQNQYVDFHTHLTTKHYYRETSNPYDIITENLQLKDSASLAKFKNSNWNPFGFNSKAKETAKESNYKNYDQANFSELENTKGSILCNSFYPFEKIMALTRFQRMINHYSVSKLPLQRLRAIGEDDNSSFREFLGEYYFARIQSETYNNSTIKFAVDSSDLALNIKNKITSYVMTIEGGQVLADLYAGNSDRIKEWEVDDATEHEILKDVHILKNLPNRLFFITTSHFSWNRISGFAKTLDKIGYRRKVISFMAKSEKQREKFFLKWGEGIHGDIDCAKPYLQTKDRYLLPITHPPYKKGEDHPVRESDTCKLDLGFKVIAEFLNPATSIYKKATYIDVKHMDIEARMEYYQLRDSLKKLYNIPIPIIASHVGVSGENQEIAMATGLNPNFDRYEEVVNPLKYYRDQLQQNDYWKSVEFYMKGKLYNPFVDNINLNTAGWFYPWSINLYDEEISEIHNSDGIMGVMLDGRQLGEGMNNYTRHYKDSIHKVFNKIIENSPTMRFKEFSEYYELEPFMRNLIYIATHCGKSVCWDHISLGSDFDGLIHPMKVCPTTSAIPILKEKLVDYFDVFIQIHNRKGMFSKFSFTQILAGHSVIDIVNKVFYSNGKRFITTYF